MESIVKNFKVPYKLQINSDSDNEYIFHADWNSSFICNFELYSSSTSISTSLDCQRVIYLISGCRKCKACMVKKTTF